MKESTTNALVGAGIGICVGAGIMYAWAKGWLPGIHSPLRMVQPTYAPMPRRIEPIQTTNPYRSSYSGLVTVD